MKVLHALFNPFGTLRGPPFWIGAVILIVVAAICHWLLHRVVVNSGTGTIAEWAAVCMLALLPTPLMYNYFCLYGKRFRDMGKSAQWFLLILPVYGVMIWVGITALQFSNEFTGLMGAAERLTEGAPLTKKAAPNIENIFHLQLYLQRKMVAFAVWVFWPLLVVNAVVSAILSLIIGTRHPMIEANPFREGAPHFE